jgi:Zn-dependent protease
MLVFAVVAHEYAHAAAALRQGDDTAYMLGRVTLNPVPHIDPVMSLLMPALFWFGSGGTFMFGGAKPVPVNPRKYRKYVRGDVIVSAAGVVTNLVLALVWAVVFVLLGLVARSLPEAAATFDIAQRMMMFGVKINLILCFFNLIPVPPLDGSHLFYHLLPPKAGSWYRDLQRFGYLPLFALLFFFRPVVSLFMAPVNHGLMLLLNWVYPFRVGPGWNIFA